MMATIYRFEDGKPIRYSVIHLMLLEFQEIWWGFLSSLILLGLVAWLVYG